MSYRIKLEGGLSERFASGFEGVTLERGAGHAVLVGRLDRSQLDGLLERLRDLGFELLGVEEVPE